MIGIPEETDKLLFDAIRQGDREAFEELFRKYYIALCNYSLTYLEEKIEAEDVVQDVFVYIWNHREKIEVQGAVKSYLFSSAKHKALNLLKHRAVERNHSRLLAEFLEDLSRTEYSEEEQLQLEQIRRVIHSMPEQCRTVFKMSCLEGKKYREIAEELRISVNTVKSHVSKAYQLIRDQIHLSGKNIFLLLVAFLTEKKDC